VTDDDVAGYIPERFEFDTQNRLYIAPRQDEDYNTSSYGALTFAAPHLGAREIVAVDFDYVLDMPDKWTAILSRRGWTGASTGLWSLASTGSPLTGTISMTITPTGTNNRLDFGIYYDNAVATTYTGLTGAAYFKVTNLRVATTTRDRINTTLGTTIAAGTRTVTPGSMANIYVGQQLRIDQGTGWGYRPPGRSAT